MSKIFGTGKFLKAC